MSSSDDLIAGLDRIAEPSQIEKVSRFFKGGDPSTEVMGVSIGSVFPVAKDHVDLNLEEIEVLLQDPRYEVRMAAVAVMNFQARSKTATDEVRKALFDLYMRRHDRINNWDLVDRAAPHVVGEYLLDKDRTVLTELARSEDPHRRRTALVSTHAFIKRGETGDTFRIADILADDPDDYVQKAIGSWTREAGKRNEEALVAFLSQNKDRLPRQTMTAASKLLSNAAKNGLRV